MILSGRDGLKEVGEKEGRWNWCLVGPNPEVLPLVGGGIGAIEEMRDCLAKQEVEQKAEKQFANFYGLMRLCFGTGRIRRTKYVFVQASRVDELGDDDAPTGGLTRGLSAVKHGQAMSQRGAMEKALLEFVHFTCKIEAKSLEELSVENVIEKLQKVSTADADLLTLEAYHNACAEYAASHPEAHAMLVPEDAHEKKLMEACAAEIFANECAPTAEVIEGVAEVVDDTEKPAPFPMDKPESADPAPAAAPAAAPAGVAAAPAAAAAPAVPEGPKYKRGDLLFVYSNAVKQWMDDGIVVATLDVTGEQDGLALPAGSLKVQYNNRRQFKWVTPAQLKQYVRPSQRPVPPPTLLGELLKETHNWMSQWHVRYFELSKGYLQWWMSSEDAKNGVVPNGSLSLTGLEMTVKETVMYIRSSGSKGMIYAFDATSVESVAKWGEMLKHHEDYCRRMQAYLTVRANEMDTNASAAPGEDNVTRHVVERKRRASSIHAGSAAAAAAIHAARS